MVIDEKTQEEILKALSLIQNICNEYGECDGCPFSDRGNGCLIRDTAPADWKITNKQSVWKALQ